MKKIVISILMFLIVGCTTVPVTGRRQLTLIPTYQLVSLSNQQFDELIKKEEVVTSTEEAKMVERVGQKISKAAENFMESRGMKNEIFTYNWEFKLLKDDDVVNAFAMPGGKVGVYTGIFSYTENEKGLAAVMSHEVAHVLAKHGGERLTHLLLIQLGGITLAKAIDEEPERTRSMAMMAYGVGAQLGFFLPYSRKHELEADQIGLYLMERAGYPPEAAIDFWQRMQQADGPRPPEFLSTHPAPEDRIEQIKKEIEQMQAKGILNKKGKINAK